MRVESRLSWLAVAAGSTLCAAVAAIGADARWLAALGGVIARAGRIPSSIPYAAAPSHDWVNVPVLGELVFHWVDALGGERGLIVLQALAVAATLALLLYDMRATGASDPARALVLMLVPFASLSALFVVRAQVFSLPLFAATVVLLRADARGRSARIWLIVPLVALWSNLHGAVLVGLVVATIYLLFARRFLVLAAVWCALFATPALERTASYYLGVLHSEPAVSGFGMWAPLSPHRPLDVLFLAVAAPLIWLAVRARPRAWELVSLGVLAASTVHVGRNSIWLLLFVAAPAATGLRVRMAARRNVLITCAWALPVILLVAAFTQAPEQTVAGPALRAHAVRLAGGRPILADPEDAERLALDGARIWIANPIDAFERDDQRDYINWLDGRSAARHDVVLVQRESEAQRRLTKDAAFREVARDSVAVLYVRR
ncbi:MAG: hypothetical protein ACJ74B_10465 [Gaiellaceae bacterium]